MAVASLPMYDLPEVRRATDAWWQGLARAFRDEGIVDVPHALERSGSHRDLWQRRDLLFSQTCGYPLTHALAGRTTLLATPCYQAEGCEGPEYSSLVIVSAECSAADIAELRGRRCAINAPESHSGTNALRALVAGHAEQGRFFGQTVISGSHIASIAMVASGEADVASIDCVTYALLRKHRLHALEGTRVLCRTPSAPGLPYITGGAASHDRLQRLRAGLARALADPALADVRAALLLTGAVELPLAAYDRIHELERSAIDAGYPALA
jgi:ABC-type phosphate/phosphonate transport system substrate-binding protein